MGMGVGRMTGSLSTLARHRESQAGAKQRRGLRPFHSGRGLFFHVTEW